VEYNKEGTIVIDEQHVISQSLSSVSMMNELLVPPRKKSSVILGNETVAYPDACSQLVFAPTFKEKTRVALLLREDYFEVVRNPERPFTVATQISNSYHLTNIILTKPLIEQMKITRRLKLQKRNDAALHIHTPKITPRIKTINTNIC